MWIYVFLALSCCCYCHIRLRQLDIFQSCELSGECESEALELYIQGCIKEQAV